MPMRILHVTDAYLPKQGGIEVQVRDLTARQVEAGHEVEVLTCAAPARSRPGWAWTAGATARADTRADGGVWRVGVPWLHVPRSSRALHGLLAERGPELVHVHLSVLSPLGILATRAAVRSGVPVVVTVHSLWWWATALYRWADLLVGWGNWPVQWTAVSDLAAGPLRRVLGGRAEVIVVPNGVDAAAWAAPAAVEVGSAPRTAPGQDPSGAPGPVTVVSVMRLALRKRPRAFLGIVRDALQMLPPGRRLRVVLVGDGPQRRAVRRRIRRLGLGEVVELPGRLDHEQIRGLYRSADLYLAPATLESFGIAALEARCAGLPVIARRNTGIADFVTDGVHGRLAADDAGLAEALAELATDHDLREDMAARNRACLPEHSWDDVLQRCSLVYKQAFDLAAPSRTPTASGSPTPS